MLLDTLKANSRSFKIVLEKRFGIKITLHKQYDRWRIYFLSETADRFKKLIEPCVVPSMKYKLG